MTIEVTDWVSIGGGVLSFFAYIEARKANSNSKDAMTALALIVEVSEKTQTYLSKRRAGSPRHYDTEYRLAEMWSRASFIIGNIDKDLSVRLDAKSNFWRHQDTWSGDLRATKDISLDYVNTKAKELRDIYA